MFEGVGIISIIINLIARGAAEIKYNQLNNEMKKKTYNPVKGTYRDIYGAERRMSDNSYLLTERTVFGEVIQRNKYGQIVRNITQEEREKRPGTVVELSHSLAKDYSLRDDEAIGIRYQDRSNNKIYVIRGFHYKDFYLRFYMDVNTGEIVRPTDGQLKFEEICKNNNRAYVSLKDFESFIFEINRKYRDKDNIFEYFRNDHHSVEYDEKDLFEKNVIKHRKEINHE